MSGWDQALVVFAPLLVMAAIGWSDVATVCACLHLKMSHAFGRGEFAIGEGPCDVQCGCDCRKFRAL